MTKPTAVRGTSETGDPLLLTPGPLTTSKRVKEVMVHDWGSRDAAFLRINKEVLDRLPDIINARGARCALFRGLHRRRTRRFRLGQPEHARPLEQELERRVAHGPEHQDGNGNTGEGDDGRHRADVGNDAGLDQQCARDRHRQEEGEIDDDRMLAEIAQRPCDMGQR